MRLTSSRLIGFALVIAVVCGCIPVADKQVYVAFDYPPTADDEAQTVCSGAFFDNFKRLCRFDFGDRLTDSTLIAQSRKGIRERITLRSGPFQRPVDYFAVVSLSLRMQTSNDSGVNISFQVPVIYDFGYGGMQKVEFKSGPNGPHEELISYIRLSIYDNRTGEIGFSCVDTESTDLDSLSCSSCYEDLFSESMEDLRDTVHRWRQ